MKIVLSFDFADWFLCSTAENWSSCICLESHYDNVMWAGLPGLIGDPNRGMLYITDGTKKTYQGITVERILSRTWTILSKEDKINVVRFYPNEILELQFLNDVTKLNLSFVNETFSRSKHKIEPLFHTNGFSSFVYLDFLRLNGDLYLYKNGGGGYSCIEKKSKRVSSEPIFDFDGGLSELIAEKISLSEVNSLEDRCECSNCGNMMNENNAYYYQDDPYCQNCFEDLFTNCYQCDEIINEDDTYVGLNGSNYCQGCFNEIFVVCQECSKIFKKEKVKYPKNNWICAKCLNATKENKQSAL